MIPRLFFLSTLLTLACLLLAQGPSSPSEGRHLYRPTHAVLNDTLPGLQPEEHTGKQEPITAEQLKAVQDSLLARQVFIRDSLEHRKRMADSLALLESQLPMLLKATILAINERLIIADNPPKIVGGSMLTDYDCTFIPFDLNKPFQPWSYKINLSDNPVKVVSDLTIGKVRSVTAEGFECQYSFLSGQNLLLINHRPLIKQSEGLYSLPVDSVFVDRLGRIQRIKRSHINHRLGPAYQRGAWLHNHLYQVKQFRHDHTGRIVWYNEVNFCRPGQSQSSTSVCNMVSYELSYEGNSVIAIRKNEPPNAFSDGEYVTEFGPGWIPNSLSFANNSKSERWKCLIEVNKAGQVTRYVYDKNGKISETLLVHYPPDVTVPQNAFESVSCFFEADGISYRQVNNTTGKSRARNKLTLEWEPWR